MRFLLYCCLPSFILRLTVRCFLLQLSMHITTIEPAGAVSVPSAPDTCPTADTPDDLGKPTVSTLSDHNPSTFRDRYLVTTTSVEAEVSKREESLLLPQPVILEVAQKFVPLALLAGYKEKLISTEADRKNNAPQTCPCDTLTQTGPSSASGAQAATPVRLRPYFPRIVAGILARKPPRLPSDTEVVSD